MSWLEVTAVFASAPEDWSPVVDAFRRHGLENTLLSDLPPSIKSCVVDVPGAEAEINRLTDELRALGAYEVDVKPYLEQNWEEAWKKFFKPRRIGRHFVVRPTWEDFEPLPGDRVIVLDPGQAFGTGDHATTRMCLELLEDAAVKGQRVLDIGCGSGVLSIGAKLLGASEVFGIDVDPLAIEVSRENAVGNGMDLHLEAADGIPDALLGPGAHCWDVVLSNIISAAIIRIAPDVVGILRPGGAWIVSGILQTNWTEVLKKADGLGLRLVSKLEEDDWVAATFLR